MRRHRSVPHGDRSIRSRRFRLLAITAIVSIGSAHAAEIVTSSVRELQTALDSAHAGDVLVLANGTYLNNTIKVAGSSITVRAATPGGVYLNGTNAISILGSDVIISRHCDHEAWNAAGRELKSAKSNIASQAS